MQRYVPGATCCVERPIWSGSSPGTCAAAATLVTPPPFAWVRQPSPFYNSFKVTCVTIRKVLIKCVVLYSSVYTSDFKHHHGLWPEGGVFDLAVQPCGSDIRDDCHKWHRPPGGTNHQQHQRADLRAPVWTAVLLQCVKCGARVQEQTEQHFCPANRCALYIIQHTYNIHTTAFFQLNSGVPGIQGT